MSNIDIQLNEINANPSGPTYSDQITSGPIVLPQKLIRLYDDEEWERFTEECAQSLKSEYVDVRRAGGAGDQGIDIAAFKTASGFNAPWDNFQCKHYDHPLYPTDIYLELGKLCYYTFTGSYTVPENYFFIAPLGIGTSLSKLLRGNHNELKRLLISEWKKYCKSKITTKHKVPLEGDFLEYVNAFDFSRIKDQSVLQLLDIHRKTSYYATRFGGGLPARPKSELPPEDIAEIEAIYIKKLLDAYAEYLNQENCSVEEIDNNATLKRHLRSARVQFYCAESLHKFSRDHLEHGEFERLQEEIFVGIENIIISEHSHGYDRVVKTVQEAYKIQIDSHPLKERLELIDRAGICHQLANNNTISWANHDQED